MTKIGHQRHHVDLKPSRFRTQSDLNEHFERHERATDQMHRTHKPSDGALSLIFVHPLSTLAAVKDAETSVDFPW